MQTRLAGVSSGREMEKHTSNRTVQKINAFNDAVAIAGTRLFGTMWLTYLFFLYGFAPLVLPGVMDKLLYWSNTIQLWALPLILVGTNLLQRAFEKMVVDIHDRVARMETAVMAQLKIVQEGQITGDEILDKMNRLLDDRGIPRRKHKEERR